jgi:hypothetical protein
MSAHLNFFATLAVLAFNSPAPMLRVADAIGVADLTQATKCNVGRYRFYSFRKHTDMPTQVAMTTSTDGWCWTAPKRKDGSGFAGAVQTPPAHGKAAVVSDPNGATRFAYRPNAGYVGKDHFSVVLHPNENVLEFTVDVQATK